MPLYVFSRMAGMVRCAIPARVVAGRSQYPSDTGIRGSCALHAALISQRDIPATLNTYMPLESHPNHRLRPTRGARNCGHSGSRGDRRLKAASHERCLQAADGLHNPANRLTPTELRRLRPLAEISED